MNYDYVGDDEDRKTIVTQCWKCHTTNILSVKNNMDIIKKKQKTHHISLDDDVFGRLKYLSVDVKGDINDAIKHLFMIKDNPPEMVIKDE